MRKYKKVVNSKKRWYGNFFEKSLHDAMAAVRAGMPLREAADRFVVPNQSKSKSSETPKQGSRWSNQLNSGRKYVRGSPNSTCSLGFPVF